MLLVYQKLKIFWNILLKIAAIRTFLSCFVVNVAWNQTSRGKDFFGVKLLILIKVFNFYQNQQLHTDRFFQQSVW